MVRTVRNETGPSFCFYSRMLFVHVYTFHVSLLYSLLIHLYGFFVYRFWVVYYI
jgi:hypothetical protein